MSLDPAYLEYPGRRRGMDHDLYPWSNLFDRAPVSWPSAANVAVAVVISLEYFPILPADRPFRAPGHMQTPYPDYRHYTSRDYGTRVGVFRLLDALAAAGAVASIAANATIAKRHPELVADLVAAGHEIVAHSTDMNGTIATGLPEDEERALIASAMVTIEEATGSRPRGWMSIARSQSWNTPRLLTEAGFAYMADWVNDDLPYRMNTPAGSIVNVPVNHELSDRQIILTQQHSAESFAEQIRDAHVWLAGEAERYGPRLLTLHLTPYVVGLPYRIGAVEALLGWLAGRPDTAFHRLNEVAGALSA